MSDKGVIGRARLRPALSVVAGIFLLAALPLLPVLADPDQVLRFNDNSLAFSLSPFVRLPGSLFRYWDCQSFFGLGNRQVAWGVFPLLDAVMGPFRFRRWGPAFIVAGTAAAVYWMLRGLGWKRRACAFSAGLLMLSGPVFTYAVSGLGVRPLALAFNALAIGFIERARRNRTWLPYLAAGACVGCGVAEVADVGAFLALGTTFFLVGTHVQRDPWLPALRRTLAALALVIAAAIPSAWQILGLMADTQIREVVPATAQGVEAQYDWATQWSVPPVESWALVAGSFWGSTSDSETAPYWGRMGRTPGWEETGAGFRNFALTGWHIGAIPVALLLALIPLARLPGADGRPWRDRKRAVLMLFGMAGTLLLAWGRFTPVYRWVWGLPYLDTIRNPEKWMFPFALFSVIGVAMSLDRILSALDSGGEDVQRVFRIGARCLFLLGLVALLLGAGLVVFQDSFLSARRAEGFGPASSVAWQHALAVSFRTILVLALAWTLWRVASLRRRPDGWFAGLSLLAALHQCVMASAYVFSQPVRPVTAPNAMTELLDARRTEGRLKMVPTGDRPELDFLLNQFRLSFLTARGYELFTPISVSRIPRDYARFFDALSGNPVRGWELGAIRYLLSGSGVVEGLQAADGHRGRFVERAAWGLEVLDGQIIPVRTSQDAPRPVRLIEFSGAAPLLYPVHRVYPVPPDGPGDALALARLASPGFQPKIEAVVHEESGKEGAYPALPENPVRALRMEPARWEADLQPLDHEVFLVRPVRFDPDWIVTADGAALPLARVNYLFQGVRVPAQTRSLVFSYRPSLRPLAVSLAARLVFLGLGIGGLFRRRGPGRRNGAAFAEMAE